MKEDVILFGDFRLSVTERLLEQNGRPVKLDDGALDVLIALVEHAREILDKSETVDWSYHLLSERKRINAVGTALAAAGGALARGLEVAGEFSDLHDQLKQAEGALREAERRHLDSQTQLAHVNRIATMGQLAASIAHEVNQPISATLMNAETALRWLAASPPKVESARQSIDRIITDGKRAADIIGRVRGLVKKAPARKEDLEINEVIFGVIALTRNEMSKNRVLVQTRLADGLPSIWGDRVQLQQVILNLMMNSVEAMSGVGDESRELTIRTTKKASEVLVAVRDSGPGFTTESFDRIFEAFYTTKPNGLGIGLSICRSIVEAHGGRLWASANEPRGATFQFTMPVHPGAPSHGRE